VRASRTRIRPATRRSFAGKGTPGWHGAVPDRKRCVEGTGRPRVVARRSWNEAPRSPRSATTTTPEPTRTSCARWHAVTAAKAGRSHER
jgi:hypothetical protein